MQASELIAYCIQPGHPVQISGTMHPSLHRKCLLLIRAKLCCLVAFSRWCMLYTFGLQILWVHLCLHMVVLHHSFSY